MLWGITFEAPTQSSHVQLEHEGNAEGTENTEGLSDVSKVGHLGRLSILSIPISESEYSSLFKPFELVSFQSMETTEKKVRRQG